MATKKVKTKDKELSLIQIANELNEVMQYGVDPETGEVDTSQQIDTELEDKALFDEIMKSASEDLAANDEDSFSPEVWKWFLDQGIAPAGMEEAEGEEGEDDPEDLGIEEEFVDEDGDAVELEEVAPAKPAKKATAKKEIKAIKEETKPTPKAKEEKKAAAPQKKEEKKIKRQPAIREKKERGPSNEMIAKEMYEAGKTVEDFIKKFTQIYTERGKDAAFGEQRGRDYYGFAQRALGIKPEKVKIEKKALKEEAKPAPKEKVEAKVAAKPKEKPAPVEAAVVKQAKKPEKKLAKKIKK